MNDATHRFTPALSDYAESIAAIAKRELDGPRWSRNARLDLHEIRSVAIAVQDHCAGHEGFEGAPAELETLLGDWAENVDYRTFERKDA